MGWEELWDLSGSIRSALPVLPFAWPWLCSSSHRALRGWDFVCTGHISMSFSVVLNFTPERGDSWFVGSAWHHEIHTFYTKIEIHPSCALLKAAEALLKYAEFLQPPENTPEDFPWEWRGLIKHVNYQCWSQCPGFLLTEDVGRRCWMTNSVLRSWTAKPIHENSLEICLFWRETWSQLSLPDSAKVTDFPFCHWICHPGFNSGPMWASNWAIWRQNWAMDSTDSFLKSATLNWYWFFPLGYFLDSRRNM